MFERTDLLTCPWRTLEISLASSMIRRFDRPWLQMYEPLAAAVNWQSVSPSAQELEEEDLMLLPFEIWLASKSYQACLAPQAKKYVCRGVLSQSQCIFQRTSLSAFADWVLFAAPCARWDGTQTYGHSVASLHSPSQAVPRGKSCSGITAGLGGVCSSSAAVSAPTASITSRPQRS